MLVCLIISVMCTESAAHGSKEEVRKLQKALPLSTYDFAFRKAGAVLWLAPFLLRALSMQLAGHLSNRTQHLRTVAAVHALITMARGLLYGVHYYGAYPCAIPTAMATQVMVHYA